MAVPMPFVLHQRLQRVLCVTAMAWGLSAQARTPVAPAPRGGVALSC